MQVVVTVRAAIGDDDNYYDYYYDYDYDDDYYYTSNSSYRDNSRNDTSMITASVNVSRMTTIYIYII